MNSFGDKIEKIEVDFDQIDAIIAL